MTLKDIAKQLTTAVQTVPNLVQILRDGFEQATAGSSGHTYSTTEQKVGTWIDGSDVYEKTFTNVTNDTELLSNVATVVDFRVSAHGTSPNLNYHCIGDGFSTNSSKIFKLIDGVVSYASWTSTAGEIEKDADFIVIQYTKSAD